MQLVAMYQKEDDMIKIRILRDTSWPSCSLGQGLRPAHTASRWVPGCSMYYTACRERQALLRQGGRPLDQSVYLAQTDTGLTELMVQRTETLEARWFTKLSLPSRC